MHLEIANPDLLTIKDSHGHSLAYGGDQSWFHGFFQKRAGCGATAASNQMAYMALSDEKYLCLYDTQSMKKNHFVKHMHEVYSYVKPGIMGVNHINKYIKGVLDYGHQNGYELTAHSLSVDNYPDRESEPLIQFLKDALLGNSPIAFLNLNVGNEHALQDWHWITIISVKITDNHLYAVASDEGIKREFDLLHWYRTTTLHGGLVFFT